MAEAYQLHKVVSKDEFPAVVRSMWDSFENPQQHLFRIFCPVNAQGASDRDAAVNESINRFWDWHISDPSSYWQKVTDPAAEDRVIGGALWKIHQSDPYAGDQHNEEAYWHPAGGQREYANQVFEIHEAARSQFARRPHVYLNIIWTHPDYQKQGVGNLILKWGIENAATLDVEMWLNAWRYGKSMYEKCGFVTIEHHQIKPQTSDPDEDWERCAHDWYDMEEWVMWRPKNGPYQEGRVIRPWLE